MFKQESLSICDFRKQYTDYYKTERSDSPKDSRTELRNLFFSECFKRLETQDRLCVLDVGAGVQILESEICSDPRFAAIKQFVQVLTIDIADVELVSLLAPEFIHIQADATLLPFPNSSIDLIVSSSALDFIGENVYPELGRVLHATGTLIATFHHPSLISIANERLIEIESHISRLDRKLSFARPNGSKAIPRLELKLLDLLRQKQDALFGKHHLPSIVFHSTAELAETLRQHFPTAIVTVNEQKGAMGENGWYTASVHR